MKILWVSNSPVGPAAEILGAEYNGTSGGWIQSEFDKIPKDEHEFYFVCSSRQIKPKNTVRKASDLGTVLCVHSPRLCYGIKNPQYLTDEIQSFINEVRPDVIHIWGTETCMSNIVANIKTDCPKFVFIQGLLGVHARYLGGYFNGKTSDIYIRPGAMDWLKEQLRIAGFRRQVFIEKDTILKCKNIICDSEFVRAYCNSLGEKLNFYEYRLMPNRVFYETKWEYDNCDKHSVFTVYSGNSEKGLQQLIKALAIVKRFYPDVKLYVPGIYPLNGDKLSPEGFYNKNICALIKAYNLDENVSFTGRLTPAGMAEYLKKANCYVNPSITEVHAGSLREAMIVGTPCITSKCGCVSEIMRHGIDGLVYRFEEYEMLASYIIDVFEKGSNALLPVGDNFKEDGCLADIYTETIL